LIKGEVDFIIAYKDARAMPLENTPCRDHAIISTMLLVLEELGRSSQALAFAVILGSKLEAKLISTVRKTTSINRGDTQ
jgi:hypothetical protein